MILDGREEVVGEVQNSDSALRTFLGRRMKRLVEDDDFQAALPGYLLPDEGSQARLGLVLERMRAIASGARVRGA